MKLSLLFLIFLSNFYAPTKESHYIYLNNLSDKNKFEVYVSEGNDVIFYGIIYPKKPVLVEMKEGKLYGIKVTQITRNLEPTTQIPDPKNPAKTVFKNDIEYYWCVDRDLVYSFGVKTNIP